MADTTKDSRKARAPRALSRRAALQAGGRIAGAAALMATVRAAFPAGVFAQAAGPEVGKATFGFIALTDFAPLAIAKEKGLFAKYGMPGVEVAKQASWGATRDNHRYSAAQAAASMARIS